MEQYFLLTTTLLLGLIGSLHCATMCGGIVALLTSSPKGNPSSPRHGLYVFMYHTGRLLSYAAAGAIASGFGETIVNLIGLENSRVVMQMITGGFLLLLGLSLIGWGNGLGTIESFGTKIWRYIQPLARKVLPIKNLGSALVAGIVWGWLPCGLVYTALVLVLPAGDVFLGVAAMVTFGLGTLPMLLLVSVFSKRAHALQQTSYLRNLVGYTAIVFGVIVFTGISGFQHQTHAAQFQESQIVKAK